MKEAASQTIIQQIQPQCSELCKKLKREKDIQGKTNKSVAQCTGVSISTVSNLFAGSAASPNVFDVSAICIHLGLSLDELMGIVPPAMGTDNSAARIAELEAQLDRANSELELVKHHSKYLEASIAERNRSYASLSKLCWFMLLPLVIYLSVDMLNSNFGFFTRNGVSGVGIAIIMTVILAVAILISHNQKEKKNSSDKKDKEKS